MLLNKNDEYEEVTSMGSSQNPVAQFDAFAFPANVDFQIMEVLSNQRNEMGDLYDAVLRGSETL